jgi:hypothetical protein
MMEGEGAAFDDMPEHVRKLLGSYEGEVGGKSVGQDTKDGPGGKKDYGLRLAYVLDQNQKLVVQCFEDPDLKCIPANEEAAKLRSGHEPVTNRDDQLNDVVGCLVR